MRTFTIRKSIDPDTFAPMGHLYLGETNTQVKYSLELPYDLHCMDQESQAAVKASILSGAIRTIFGTVPDVTAEEVCELMKLFTSALEISTK